MKKRGSAVYAVMFLILVLIVPAAYAATCSDWVARVDSFQGNVQTKISDSTEWKPVIPKDQLCAGDMIRVLQRSRAVIVLKNETVMRLDQNTTVTLSAQTKEKPSLLDLLKGAAYFISRTPQKFRVNTPFLNAGIEGTEFLVSVRDADAMVSVFEGVVLAENSAGSIRLLQGQTASAKAGSAPVLSMTIKPKDAVQWTLYYPLVSVSKAYESLSARVSSLLASGAAAEAAAELAKVLSAEPDNADALSFMSVIAVAQNEKSRAVEYAKKAVASAPNSGTAHIALSYALQAGFDLNAALQSVRTAVQLEPDNALAWARLSELYMSSGEKNESLKAAVKAAGLAPELSRTQTVLGFAHLAQIKTDEAMAAFEKAAVLDPSDPLPRLGLGLAKIRKGHLEDGRREIEIAVSLDTGSALIRSYLGKAYHEEKRDSVAADQFSMAKEADPKDPTAFFYGALQKQSQNRPVEALQDLEKSMELNDNRAVYRSKLLLDEDQAARGASLARIYDDLGFQQLALSEGYKSVNADPANASAHRFLSDAFLVLPRHEYARINELLHAQLLQPVGLNPVQPHLAEPGLFILQGAGPADAGFNEYTQLFDRNRISLQLSGIAGNHRTFGDELVVSGLHEKLSFSIGQFHYETDGFRLNNDRDRDIYNAYAQLSLSPDTSLQIEFRSSENVHGDLDLHFDPDEFAPDYREKVKEKSMRLGMRHTLAADSVLVASLIFKDRRQDIHTEPFALFSFDSLAKSRGTMAEVQHLFHLGRMNLTSGAGLYDLDEKFEFFLDSASISAGKGTVRYRNIYFYPQISLASNLTFTAGASAETMEGSSLRDGDRINPKLGVIWMPLTGTSVRAAYFSTLARPLVTYPTIEPTQVAGFNQFFDDTEGTKARRYGFGIDQKISSGLYAGAEISWRELDVPYMNVFTAATESAEWKERMGRAYLNWNPNRRIALSAEYLYERFDRGIENVGVEMISHLKTHKVPLGVSYFCASGLSASMKATFVSQSGEFGEPLFGSMKRDSDQFWVVDAGLKYRLPGRRGIISIEGKNLFDKGFRFQEMDPRSPAFFPQRSIFAKLTLSF